MSEEFAVGDWIRFIGSMGGPSSVGQVTRVLRSGGRVTFYEVANLRQRIVAPGEVVGRIEMDEASGEIIRDCRAD